MLNILLSFHMDLGYSGDMLLTIIAPIQIPCAIGMLIKSLGHSL